MACQASAVKGLFVILSVPAMVCSVVEEKEFAVAMLPRGTPSRRCPQARYQLGRARRTFCSWRIQVRNLLCLALVNPSRPLMCRCQHPRFLMRGALPENNRAE